MTHEELRLKVYLIDKYNEATNEQGTENWQEVDKALQALQSVVELAITAVNGNPNTAYSMGYAAACERIIQSIEKELL